MYHQKGGCKFQYKFRKLLKGPSFDCQKFVDQNFCDGVELH